MPDGSIEYLGPPTRARHHLGLSRAAAPRTPEQSKLWKQCQALEAEFLKQMLEAMRQTAPDVDALFGHSAGLGMTRQMLDEKLSERLAERGAAGIATTLYDDLARWLAAGPSRGPSVSVDVGPDTRPTGSGQEETREPAA